MDRRLLTALLVTSLFTVTLVPPATAQSVGASDGAKARDAKKDDKDKAKRLDKLDKDDRAALDSSIGYVAPEFTSGIDWISDGGAPSMKSLRGKVVVVQTFTTKTATGRTLPDRIAKAMAEFKADDVQIIAVHTPENADKADAQLGKSKLEMPTGIDRDGAFCDLVGAYKRPVNIVVDRTGDVKFAGLTIDGVVDSVKELLASEYDPANKPNERPKETSVAKRDFPTFNTAVTSAVDLRGKSSPPLPRNMDWFTNAPSTQGRLVVVDFWATWCNPCRAAIPHMNEIAKEFSRDVACMGISDESSNDFDKGLRRYGLTRTSFGYAVGTDPMGSMKKGFGITGIPHVAVISTDGVVRWQGHPSELSASVMRQLVEANRSLASIGSGNGGGADRWKRDMENAPTKGREREKRKSY